MKNLKPCPFCGGDDIRPYGAAIGFVCHDCGVTGPQDPSSPAWNQRATDPAAESLDLIADAKRQGRDPDDMVMLNRQQTRIIELTASSKKLAEALRLASLDCCPDMKIVGEDLVPCSEYLTKDNWCASCIARAALKDW